MLNRLHFPEDKQILSCWIKNILYFANLSFTTFSFNVVKNLVNNLES